MFKNNLFKKIPVSTQACYWYCFLLCMALLGFAIYLETVMLLAPCPLCELQRLMFLLVAFFSLLGGLLRPKRKGILWFGFFIGLFALLGALLAGHQVWLESHPPANPNACGMSLSYLFGMLPFSQAVKVAIMGTGDCAAVTWRLLGLSIPAWSLMSFITILIVTGYQVRRAPK
jgi:disulfide bond formation protein DsbB